MKKICAWCGAEMPEADEPISVEGLDIEGEPISHGLCEACEEAMGDDIMGPPHRLYDEDHGW